jgi:hypothetical protein
MSSLDQAVQTQLDNIQKKTGKSLDELTAAINASGLSKHSELREIAMQAFGLGYGDANALVHYAMKSNGERAAEGKTTEDVLGEIYNGPKAALRPIHEALMAEINDFGQFEIAPKKGYVSLRRKKQFVMIGPATNTRVEVGLNMKGVPGSDRLVEQPAGGMCNYKVKLTRPDEVDADLIAWLKQAYESAG